jgi:peptide/nickel transport system permease protein
MIWLRRLALLISTIFFAMTLTFLIIHFMPGDPVENMALNLVKDEGVDYETAYRNAKSMLNYDPSIPIYQQYVKYVFGLLGGNLGVSLQYKKPVIDIIAGALPWTLLVLSVSLLLSFLIGILAGMYIAWKRKTILDPILSVYASIVGAVPEFVIAFLLIILFAMRLQWFPSRGSYSSGVVPGFNLPFMISVFSHMFLIVAAYVIDGVGSWAINMKGNAMNILGEDYITSARARGLSDGRIVTKYVGRNAMLPLVTHLAISFGLIFGGSPVIERLFVYPGIGFYMNQAIANRDYLLMQGLFLMVTVTVVFANFFAEMLYSALDPRVRREA